MNRFFAFVLAFMQGCVAYAANPSFGSFNANQFNTAGNIVSIKDGVIQTNINSTTASFNNVTITNEVEVRGNIKGGTLVITNDVRFFNNTYISNFYSFNGILTNNLTVFGNSALNTFTAQSGTVSNDLAVLDDLNVADHVEASTLNATTITQDGEPVATYRGITNVLTFALSDMTTALTTGTNKNYWYAPAAGMTIKWVRATLATTSSSGNPVFDINEAGTSILSTKITVEAGEWDSLDATSQPVISDSAIASKAKVDFDIDVAGTAAAGAQIQIGFTVP